MAYFRLIDRINSTCNETKESHGMDDDLIFLLSLNIMGLFIIDWLGRHYFGLEAAWSVINTMATMYYCHKHRKDK